MFWKSGPLLVLKVHNIKSLSTWVVKFNHCVPVDQWTSTGCHVGLTGCHVGLHVMADQTFSAFGVTFTDLFQACTFVAAFNKLYCIVLYCNRQRDEQTNGLLDDRQRRVTETNLGESFAKCAVCNDGCFCVTRRRPARAETTCHTSHITASMTRGALH